MASLENILVDVILLFTHAESSSVRLEAYSNHAPLSVCLSQSVCLCQHDKTKTAETKIVKLCTDTSPTKNEY